MTWRKENLHRRDISQLNDDLECPLETDVTLLDCFHGVKRTKMQMAEGEVSVPLTSHRQLAKLSQRFQRKDGVLSFL